MSRKYGKTFVLTLLACLCAGCICIDDTPQSSISIQAIQTREFDCSYKVAFASVVSVFHDLGYSIKTSDRKSGIITAQSTISLSKRPLIETMLGEEGDISHMSYTVADVQVEEMSDGKCCVRVSFVRHWKDVRSTGAFSEESKHVIDPEHYKDFFAKVDKNIFVKQNIKN
jgi:hypothetical protein